MLQVTSATYNDGAGTLVNAGEALTTDDIPEGAAIDAQVLEQEDLAPDAGGDGSHL